MISAARVSLSLAILSLVALGDPTPGVRIAMGYQPVAAGPAQPVAVVEEPTIAATPSPPPTPTPVHPPADGPPTWIEAPAIHLDAPVVEIGWTPTTLDGAEATEWQVPDSAAGFHKGSAYPGHPGNTVISGHHNIGGEVFRYLVDLQVGDQVTLYVGRVPYRYQVVHKELVREQGVSDEVRRDNARWITTTVDERLTLVTCWPYSGNSHRLIVVAFPIP